MANRAVTLLVLTLLVPRYSDAWKPITDNNQINSSVFNKMLFLYVNSLYEEDKNLTYNILKVTLGFCPNQTICPEDRNQVNEIKTDLQRERNHTIVTTHGLGNESRTDFELLSKLGLCCAYCSCEDRCYENENCCPSKVIRDDISNLTENKSSHRQECTAPNIKSYKKTTAEPKFDGLPYYLMIKKCFVDRSNDTLVQRCETPSVYVTDEALPVTSISTARTYWNKFCAVCNEDDFYLVTWKPKFNTSPTMSYMRNHRDSRWVLPQTFDELYRILVRTNSIYFVPPVELENKVCFPKAGMERCEEPGELQMEFGNSTYFQEACERFHSPVITLVNVYVDLVVFTRIAGTS